MLGLSEQRNLEYKLKGQVLGVKSDQMALRTPERFTFPEVFVYMSMGNKSLNQGNILRVINPEMFVLSPLQRCLFTLHRLRIQGPSPSLSKDTLFTLRRQVLFSLSGGEGGLWTFFQILNFRVPLLCCKKTPFGQIQVYPSDSPHHPRE